MRRALRQTLAHQSLLLLAARFRHGTLPIFSIGRAICKSERTSSHLARQGVGAPLRDKMRAHAVLPALFVLGARGVRVLQSNDDGWAELYIRSFNDALNAAGHDVVLSGPAENKSGSGKASRSRHHHY